MVARDVRGLRELLDHDRRRREVGVPEAEVDHVFAAPPELELELVDRREDVRRQVAGCGGTPLLERYGKAAPGLDDVHPAEYPGRSDARRCEDTLDRRRLCTRPYALAGASLPRRRRLGRVTRGGCSLLSKGPAWLVTRFPANATPAGSASSPTPPHARRAPCSTRRSRASRGCATAARTRPTGETGDGAGVLLPIPATLLPGPWCGLAMVFLARCGRARGDRRPPARRKGSGPPAGEPFPSSPSARRDAHALAAARSSSSCSCGRSAIGR